MNSEKIPHTKLLYLENSYLFSSHATLLAFEKMGDDTYAVILDQTIFHPQGGGQPTDTGVINSESFTFKVNMVRFKEGIVYHFGNLVDGNLHTDVKVSLTIDKERRILHSKLHSAGHLIDDTLVSLGLDLIPVKGFHFPQGAYVEYKGTLPLEIREQTRKDLEKTVNERIQQGFAVKTMLVPPDQLHQYCRYIPDYLPKDKPTRVVFVYGEHGAPCGGTHVKNIKEIGYVEISKIKTKSGNTRISYRIKNQ